jgi:glucoamylase
MYEPGIIHWSVNGWQTDQDTSTRDTGLGLHLAELETQALRSGQIDFTFRNTDTGEWLGSNYTIEIKSS